MPPHCGSLSHHAGHLQGCQGETLCYPLFLLLLLVLILLLTRLLSKRTRSIKNENPKLIQGFFLEGLVKNKQKLKKMDVRRRDPLFESSVPAFPQVWELLTCPSSPVNLFMAVPTIYAKLLEHHSNTGMKEGETVKPTSILNPLYLKRRSLLYTDPIGSDIFSKFC